MSIDKFLNKKYNYQNYNCLHFSRDVWLDITGIDISEKLGNLLGKLSTRKINSDVVNSFIKLSKPETPCIVLMKRPRVSPHMGIYIDGYVLHIRNSGVEFFPLDMVSLGFKTVKFYK